MSHHHQDVGDYGVQVAPGTLRFERLLPGPIERVWEWLVDPEKRALWFAGGAIEPRPGGAFEMRFHNATLSDEPVPERYAPHSGIIEDRQKVLRFDPPHLLAFSWSDPGVESEVQFELAAEGERVRLVLTHSRLPDAERLDVSGGWHIHLAMLAARLEGHEPPPFWTTLAMIEDEYQRRESTG